MSAAGGFTFPSFPPPPLVRAGAPKRVVIVGAGAAGLVAALALRDAGHEVLVLEGSDRPGGRIETFREGFSDGLYANVGACFLPGFHTLTIGYALQFGLTLVSRLKAGRTVYVLQGQRVDDPMAGQWPVLLSWGETLGNPVTWSTSYLANVTNGVLAADPRDPAWPPAHVADIDAVSFAELLHSQGASSGAVQVIRRGYLDLWGEGIDQCSALHVLRDEAFASVPPVPGAPPSPAPRHTATPTFAMRAVASPASDAKGPPSRGPIVTSPDAVDPHALYHIDGGNDLLPKAMAEALSGAVRYGAWVTAMAQDDAGVTLHVAGDSTPVTADYVIMTAPFSAQREIAVTPAYSPMRARVTAEVPYTSVLRVLLEFSQRFWLADGLCGSANTDLPEGNGATVPGIWIEDASAVQDGTCGILDCYIVGETARRLMVLPPAEAADVALAQVEVAFPGARAHYTGNHALKSWDADPGARGGYCYFRPGQLAALSPHLATPEGRIHFAGEAISALPAWIQGAMESGLRAAAEVNAR